MPIWSEKYQAWYRENSRDLYVFGEQGAYRSLNIGSGDRVLDLGGHIGCFSLYALRAGAKEVVSVEPEPDSFEVLKRNVEIFANCTTIQAAAVPDPAPAEITFYVVVPPPGKKVNQSHGLFAPSSSKMAWPRRKITVAAISIAKLLRDRSYTVVKCDVEGAEYLLFKKPFIFPDTIRAVAIEFHFTRASWVDAAKEIVLSMADQGFFPSRSAKIERGFGHVWVWNR